jgi:hypothetical protein
MIFMMSKLKISMLESVELNIQTHLWAIAGHCQTARQQLDYWGGCTMQAMGWISAGLTRWDRPMVFRYFHHCIHFW